MTTPKDQLREAELTLLKECAVATIAIIVFITVAWALT
jgi:hypothetical protein